MPTIETLMDAIQEHDTLTVRRIALQTPDIMSEHDEQGRTPLSLAYYVGSKEIADILLESSDYEPSLHESVIRGDESAVQKALLADKSRMESFSPDGWTPLQLATYFGHLNLVRWLIEQGASIKTVSNNADKYRAIHLVVVGTASLNILKFLLDHKANPNAESAGKITPLHLAAANGKDKVAAMLIKYGAKSSVSAEGNTPMDLAEKQGHDFLKKLLEDSL